MAATEDAAEPLLIDMGVDLGGCDARVTQHLLDRAQIGPAAQQMSGEGMPQHVGRHILADCRPLSVLFQTTPEQISVHRRPAWLNEKPIGARLPSRKQRTSIL